MTIFARRVADNEILRWISAICQIILNDAFQMLNLTLNRQYRRTILQK